MPQRERVFMSYSHEDVVWLKRVREQLTVLEREGLIDIFDDTLIAGGEGWYSRLDQEMLRAKLAVLLVVMQFEGGTRILRVIHRRDARATPSNCTATGFESSRITERRPDIEASHDLDARHEQS